MTPFLFILHRLSQSPLESLFTLLIFIFAKELNATPFQLTILASTKPLVSFIAFRSNLFLANRQNLKKPFLLVCCLVSSTMCMLFPLMNDPWFFIAAYAVFMASVRATTSVWIECLKEDLRLSRFLSLGSALNYGIMIGVPLAAAYFMDHYEHIWKILFFSLGAFQLINLIGLYFLDIVKKPFIEMAPVNSWKLLKENPAFARYQLLFFIGGLGLVALQPILPLYFKETLSLSYLELVGAFSVCRGVAFVCSSPFWVRFLDRTSIYHLSAFFNLFGAIFIGFLLLAQFGMAWLYVAYLFYGALQSGCELTWNFSAPFFSKGKESLPYAGVNHLFIGMRGCITPFLGQFLFMLSGITGVFIFSGALSLISTWYAYKLENPRLAVEKAT